MDSNTCSGKFQCGLDSGAQREEEQVRQVIASTIPSDPLRIVHSRVGKVIASRIPPSDNSD